MDADDRELFRHLMARATVMLEDAAGLAVEGHSLQISQYRTIELAGQLQTAARDVGALTEAAAIVASRGINQED